LHSPTREDFFYHRGREGFSQRNDNFQEQKQCEGTELLGRALCGRKSTMIRLMDYKIGEIMIERLNDGL
jgi:hypothetical protein